MAGLLSDCSTGLKQIMQMAVCATGACQQHRAEQPGAVACRRLADPHARIGDGDKAAGISK